MSLCFYCACVSKWQVNVGHPSEVDEIFDAISYSKGASVIRMLHNYIGDEVRKKKKKQACGKHSVVPNLNEQHTRFDLLDA